MRIAGYDGTIEWDIISGISGITRWELKIEDEAPDATVMEGGGWREIVSGQRKWHASVDVIYDTTDKSWYLSPGTYFEVGEFATLNLDTAQSDGDAIFYEGHAMLKSFAVTVEVDGVVKFTLEFQGDGIIGYCDTSPGGVL